MADAFADQISEWIDRSSGRIRAGVVHKKLRAMGYTGSERTTRRVVAALKALHQGHHWRISKAWITKPGGHPGIKKLHLSGLHDQGQLTPSSTTTVELRLGRKLTPFSQKCNG